MPRDKSDTLQRIIPCARQEFLEKGFEQASMRSIAANAGLTAAGLYRHFANKEAMFASLVEPAVQELLQLYIAAHADFEALPSEVQRERVFEYTDDKMTPFLNCVYRHFDAFRLLLGRAEGTAYADFLDRMVEIEVESTLKFIHATGNAALSKSGVTPGLLHIVSSAFLSAIFEVVRHDMPREKADRYVFSLQQFFTAGWQSLLS